MKEITAKMVDNRLLQGLMNVPLCKPPHTRPNRERTRESGREREVYTQTNTNALGPCSIGFPVRNVIPIL